MAFRNQQAQFHLLRGPSTSDDAVTILASGISLSCPPRVGASDVGTKGLDAGRVGSHPFVATDRLDFPGGREEPTDRIGRLLIYRVLGCAAAPRSVRVVGGRRRFEPVG